jgi:hypothetical protein
MTHRSQIASGEVAPGEILTVELALGTDRHTVIVTLPSALLTVSVARFPDLVAAITRTLSNASLELARLDAAEKRG